MKTEILKTQSNESIAANLADLHPQWLDRKTNDYPYFFSLKKISYPTGGTTTYEYEPNQYRESNTNDPLLPVINGCGQRIKQITSQPGGNQPAVITKFTYGENEDGAGIIDYTFFNDIHKQFYKEIFSFNLTYQPGAYIFNLSPVRTFSPKPIEFDMRFNNPISYSKVTVYEYSESSGAINGKYVVNYDIPTRYYTGSMTMPQLKTQVSSVINDPVHTAVLGSYLGAEPTLRSKIIYDKDNNLIHKEECHYSTIGTGLYSGIRVQQQVYFNTYATNYPDNYYFTDGYFEYGTTYTQMNRTHIDSKEVTDVGKNGTALTVSEVYEYNDNNQLTRTTRTNSYGGSLVKELSYPTGTSLGVYGEMFSKNIVSRVIKEKVIENNNEIQIVKSDFTDDPSIAAGLIMPYAINNSFTGESNLSVEMTYDKYDEKGNILQFTPRNGVRNSFLWGYYKRYPIAQAYNAKYNEIFFDGFEEGATWDGIVYDRGKAHTGRVSARIDKPTGGELYYHSAKWLNVTLTSPTKFKYSGWIYSTGPSAEIFLFMKRQNETGYFSYVDSREVSQANKWIFVEGEYTVPADVTQLNIRIDNNGGRYCLVR